MDGSPSRPDRGTGPEDHLRKEIQRLRIVAELGESVAGADSLARIYEGVLAALELALGVDRASIRLIDPDGVMRFKAWRNLSEEYRTGAERPAPWRRGDSDPQAVLVPDVERDDSPLLSRELIRREGIGALGFVPLVYRGALIGALTLGFDRPHEFTPSEIETASGIARHLAVSVARARSERRLTTQYEVTRILGQASSLADASRQVLRSICALLGWGFGAMWAVDEAAGVLRCVESWHPSPFEVGEFEAVTRSRTFDPGVGLPGRIWASGEPAWIPDVTKDSNFPRAPIAAREGLHGAFGFPIVAGESVIAVMEFFSHEILQPDEDLLALMAGVGGQIGLMMERRTADETRRESDALKSAVLESALDCVFVMDHEGRLIDMNAVAERTFGYVRDQVLGRPLAELIIPPELRDRHRKGLARYLSTGQSTIIGHRLELTAIRANGSVFPVELAISRVDIPGAPKFTGYLRDISERQRNEEVLRFLAEASESLSATLEPEESLQQMAQLSVPFLADWCTTYLLQPDGSIRRLGTRFADPGKEELARELTEGFRIDPGSDEGVPKVLRTGTAEFHPAADARLLSIDVDDPEGMARLMEPLGIVSWMCVPLRARGRILGAISFLTAESGRTFGGADLTLAGDLARRAGLALDNAMLFSERNEIATTLQRSLLPPELPQIEGVQLAGRYLAAGRGNEVGGDFYDVFQAGRNSWAVAIGDVCGKGAAAAGVMAQARYTIRAAAIREGSPRAVLQMLNEAMLRGGHDRFCTVCYARMIPGPDRVLLMLSRGGHPAPLLVRANGSVDAVGIPGSLIGIHPDPQFHDQEVGLDPGDALVLYTDGVTDARRDREQFGEKRLASVLQAHVGSDAETIAREVEHAVTRFCGSAPRDDLAIVVIRCPR